MKYKVGDKVRIKSREWYDAAIKTNHGSVQCGEERFVREMMKYLGKTFTIESIGYEKYRMKDAEWDWTDDMIEGYADDKREIFTIPDDCDCTIEIKDGKIFANITKKKRWRAENGGKYLFVDSILLEISNITDNGCSFDENSYNNGNYFNPDTERELAEQYLEKVKKVFADRK